MSATSARRPGSSAPPCGPTAARKRATLSAPTIGRRAAEPARRRRREGRRRAPGSTSARRRRRWPGRQEPLGHLALRRGRCRSAAAGPARARAPGAPAGGRRTLRPSTSATSPTGSRTPRAARRPPARPASASPAPPAGPARPAPQLGVVLRLGRGGPRPPAAAGQHRLRQPRPDVALPPGPRRVQPVQRQPVRDPHEEGPLARRRPGRPPTSAARRPGRRPRRRRRCRASGRPRRTAAAGAGRSARPSVTRGRDLAAVPETLTGQTQGAVEPRPDVLHGDHHGQFDQCGVVQLPVAGPRPSRRSPRAGSRDRLGVGQHLHAPGRCRRRCPASAGRRASLTGSMP